MRKAYSSLTEPFVADTPALARAVANEDVSVRVPAVFHRANSALVAEDEPRGDPPAVAIAVDRPVVESVAHAQELDVCGACEPGTPAVYHLEIGGGHQRASSSGIVRVHCREERGDDLPRGLVCRGSACCMPLMRGATAAH